MSSAFQDVSTRLIACLPELQSPIEAEVAEWLPEEPGPVNLFDEVFDPFLIEALKSGRDREILGRAFEFLESLATSTDDVLAELVSCPTAESIVAEPEVLPLALELSGPRTADCIRIVRDWKPPTFWNWLRRAASRRITNRYRRTNPDMD